MLKWLARAVALILVPVLVADPVTASAFSSFTPTVVQNEAPARSLFEEQAICQALLSPRMRSFAHHLYWTTVDMMFYRSSHFTFGPVYIISTDLDIHPNPQQSFDEPTATRKTKLRVLLIDDDPQEMALRSNALRRLGNVEIVEVKFANEAVRTFKTKGPFDLVDTDWAMDDPELPGTEIARQILEISPGTPIVLVTKDVEQAGLLAQLTGIKRVFNKKTFDRSEYLDAVVELTSGPSSALTMNWVYALGRELGIAHPRKVEKWLAPFAEALIMPAVILIPRVARWFIAQHKGRDPERLKQGLHHVRSMMLVLSIIVAVFFLGWWQVAGHIPFMHHFVHFLRPHPLWRGVWSIYGALAGLTVPGHMDWNVRNSDAPLIMGEPISVVRSPNPHVRDLIRDLLSSGSAEKHTALFLARLRELPTESRIEFMHELLWVSEWLAIGDLFVYILNAESADAVDARNVLLATLLSDSSSAAALSLQEILSYRSSEEIHTLLQHYDHLDSKHLYFRQILQVSHLEASVHEGMDKSKPLEIHRLMELARSYREEAVVQSPKVDLFEVARSVVEDTLPAIKINATEFLATMSFFQSEMFEIETLDGLLNLSQRRLTYAWTNFTLRELYLRKRIENRSTTAYEQAWLSKWLIRTEEAFLDLLRTSEDRLNADPLERQLEVDKQLRKRLYSKHQDALFNSDVASSELTGGSGSVQTTRKSVPAVPVTDPSVRELLLHVFGPISLEEQAHILAAGMGNQGAGQCINFLESLMGVSGEARVQDLMSYLLTAKTSDAEQIRARWRLMFKELDPSAVPLVFEEILAHLSAEHIAGIFQGLEQNMLFLIPVFQVAMIEAKLREAKEKTYASPKAKHQALGELYQECNQAVRRDQHDDLNKVFKIAGKTMADMERLKQETSVSPQALEEIAATYAQEVEAMDETLKNRRDTPVEYMWILRWRIHLEECYLELLHLHHVKGAVLIARELDDLKKEHERQRVEFTSALFSPSELSALRGIPSSVSPSESAPPRRRHGDSLPNAPSSTFDTAETLLFQALRELEAPFTKNPDYFLAIPDNYVKQVERYITPNSEDLSAAYQEALRVAGIIIGIFPAGGGQHGVNEPDFTSDELNDLAQVALSRDDIRRNDPVRRAEWADQLEAALTPDAPDYAKLVLKSIPWAREELQALIAFLRGPPDQTIVIENQLYRVVIHSIPEKSPVFVAALSSRNANAFTRMLPSPRKGRPGVIEIFVRDLGGAIHEGLEYCIFPAVSAERSAPIPNHLHQRHSMATLLEAVAGAIILQPGPKQEPVAIGMRIVRELESLEERTWELFINRFETARRSGRKKFPAKNEPTHAYNLSFASALQYLAIAMGPSETLPLTPIKISNDPIRDWYDVENHQIRPPLFEEHLNRVAMKVGQARGMKMEARIIGSTRYLQSVRAEADVLLIFHQPVSEELEAALIGEFNKAFLASAPSARLLRDGDIHHWSLKMNNSDPLRISYFTQESSMDFINWTITHFLKNALIPVEKWDFPLRDPIQDLIAAEYWIGDKTVYQEMLQDFRLTGSMVTGRTVLSAEGDLADARAMFVKKWERRRSVLRARLNSRNGVVESIATRLSRPTSLYEAPPMPAYAVAGAEERRGAVPAVPGAAPSRTARTRWPRINLPPDDPVRPYLAQYKYYAEEAVKKGLISSIEDVDHTFAHILRSIDLVDIVVPIWNATHPTLSPITEKERQLLRIACACHDLGKYHENSINLVHSAKLYSEGSEERKRLAVHEEDLYPMYEARGLTVPADVEAVLRRELALLKHKTIQEQAISDRVVLLSGLFLGIDVCDGIYDGTREYHRENWTPGVYPEPEEAAATLSKKLQGHDPHGVSEFFSDLLKNNEFARALDRTIPDYVAGKFLEADARHRWSEQNPILPIVHLVRMAILYNLTGRPTPLGDLWKTLTAKVFRGDRSAGTRQTFEAVMRIYYENPDAFSPETVVNGPPPAIGNKPSASILEPVAKRSWGAGSLHYMLYTIAAAPLWETALFFTPHGIPGILWATLGFAFAHTIVAWIVRIRDLGWSGSFNRADLKQDGHDFLRNLGLSLLFLSPSLLTHSLGFFGAVELSIVLHAAYNAVVLMGLLPDRVQAILAPGSVFDRLAVKDRPEPVDESTRLGAIALRQWLVTYPPEFRMLLEKTMQAMVDRSAGDEMALEGISPKHLQNRKFYRGSISDSELETFVTLLTDNQKLQSSILDPRVAHPDVPLLGEISLALESAVERMSDARAVSYAQKANLSALYAEIYLAFAEKLPTLKSQLTSRSLSEIQVIDEPPATSEVIEALGRAMDPSSDGPWTVVFFDLDDLGTYIKAWPDVMVDHYVSLFDEHLRKTHPEARVGRVGGDEFFMVIPQDGPEVMALLAEQQNSFRNINPYQRYRPITFSAGVVTKDQLLKYGRGFKETYDPTARFQIAREMASQPLKRVKDELGKATISLYTPPTWKEWWDDIRDRLWKRRVVKPLHPETYKSPRFKPLLVDLDVHAPIPPSVRVGRPGSVIRRFEKPEDFDNRVEALGNRAHLLLKIEHTYASRDLNEVYEKMNAAGSRVYGERMGGKAWNTLNISGQIFNEIILAQRTVEYDALADAFANLPPQWQGELWFVRGPPDKISIAILAADDGNQFEQENERLRNEAMAFEGLFTRVLDNAEREMNGDAWYSPIFNEARGTNVQLNAVVKVVGRSYREAADQMKRMRKVLLHETGSELSSHPKPRRRLVMLGHNQTLDPEDYQTSMDIRRTEKVAADKELLIDRTAPKKGETTPAMVNQAIRELHRLPLPVKEMIRVIKLIKRTSPQLAALIKAQGYQVILCGDQTTKELSPGVTLYAGMQQKTIYLAMGEYLQLKNIGDAFDQGLLYLAGRIGRVVQDIRIRETVVVSSLSGSFAHNQGVQREQSITGRPGVSGKAILIDNKDKKIPSPLPRFTKSAGSQLLDRQG